MTLWDENIRNIALRRQGASNAQTTLAYAKCIRDWSLESFRFCLKNKILHTLRTSVELQMKKKIPDIYSAVWHWPSSLRESKRSLPFSKRVKRISTQWTKNFPIRIPNENCLCQNESCTEINNKKITSWVLYTIAFKSCFCAVLLKHVPLLCSIFIMRFTSYSPAFSRP